MDTIRKRWHLSYSSVITASSSTVESHEQHCEHVNNGLYLLKFVFGLYMGFLIGLYIWSVDGN
jgi:hypothetical protein